MTGGPGRKRGEKIDGGAPRIVISMPPDLRARVEEEAARDGLSVARWMRTAAELALRLRDNTRSTAMAKKKTTKKDDVDVFGALTAFVTGAVFDDDAAKDADDEGQVVTFRRKGSKKK